MSPIRHQAMKLVKYVLLLTVSALLAAAAAEIMVRAAARYLLDVEYLATAGIGNMPRVYGSLEDFLSQFRAHLIPHRIWNNYYANSLGFTGREFAIEKPAGTRRIMALGDSFAYGLVAYPQNVLTLVEAHLRQECRDDIEVMNFGIPASGVWEYRWLHRLAAPRYKPDTVILHFYMGNDGPDTIFGTSEVPTIGGHALSSYAWNFLVNSVKVLRSLNHARSGSAIAAAAGSTEDRAIRGGERVSDQPDLTDRELQPSFTEEAFAEVEAAELARLYRGQNTVPPGFDPWRRTLDVLDELRAEVIASTGQPPIMILYPSALQVYPERLEAAKRAAAKRFPFVDPAGFDPTIPSRVLLEYCRRATMSCFDITPAMTAAAKDSPDPLYRPRDTHWNVRGNRIAAEAEAALLQPLVCSSSQ